MNTEFGTGHLSIIHPMAAIHHSAKIGPFSIIHAGVQIEEGVTIGSHCEIGVPTPLAKSDVLVIPRGALIRSHNVIYLGSTFGPELETGHHVTIRENTSTGKGLRIGTLADLQGDISIGDYVRIHSGVFIAKGSCIDDFAWLLPHVVLTNDPHPPSEVSLGITVESYAAIGARSVILPGIVVGRQSLTAAGSVVTRDVPPNCVVGGIPAKCMGDAASIELRDGSGRPAYPWTQHFLRGYPNEVIEHWRQQQDSEKTNRNE